MRDVREILRERQVDVRLELDRRGILLKQVSFNSGLSEATLRSYFPAGHRKVSVMPICAFYQLVEKKALPEDLLTLLLPPAVVLVRLPEGVDHDEVAPRMHEYLAAKTAAHHPDSPGGVGISECEDEKLKGHLAAVPTGT